MAGNITPYGEFNFVADALAADVVMKSSKGFDRSDQCTLNRLALIENRQVAPMHLVVLPIDRKFQPPQSLNERSGRLTYRV